MFYRTRPSTYASFEPGDRSRGIPVAANTLGDAPRARGEKSAAGKYHSSSGLRSSCIWFRAGKRAESVGEEKNAESGPERSRREKQVVVATPVVGALMHLCIHISVVSLVSRRSVRSRLGRLSRSAATTRRKRRRRRGAVVPRQHRGRKRRTPRQGERGQRRWA